MTGYTEDAESALAEGQKELGELIKAAAAVKAGVVSRDQFEKGERRVLNLGHTFAHAVETLVQKENVGAMPTLTRNRKDAKVTHGEAVAMGIVMAAKLADRLNLSEGGLAEKIESDFRSCGLPVEAPYTVEDMAQAMMKDKKAEDGKVHFILPREVGKVEIVDLSVDEVVKFMK